LRDGLPSEISNALDWRDAGPELSPEEWHEELRLLRDDDESSLSSSSTTLLDCRNLYESDQGTFQGAIPLGTQTFQESWESLEERTKEFPRDEPVHIFCTGGIRCVKVGAYLKQQLGFSDIRRLQHGIIGYQQWMEEQQLEQAAEVEPTASLWEGDNFLFDKRQSKDLAAKKGESSNE
jgi:predicted sulfurtransferase